MLKIKNYSDPRRNKNWSNKIIDNNSISFNKMWGTDKIFLKEMLYSYMFPFLNQKKLKTQKIKFLNQNN